MRDLVRSATPQKFDAVVRTLTTSLMSLGLVATLIARVLTYGNSTQPTYLDLVLVSLTSSIVSFYVAGHVATNTASLEEERLRDATSQSEASALRSEAAAPKREERP